MNSKLVFVLALIAISAGLYGVFGGITEPQKVVMSSPAPKEQVRTVPVWKANRNLGRAQKIKRSDLHIEHIPETRAATYGVAKGFSIDFKKRWYLNKSLSEDEIVKSEDLLQPGDDGYISLVIKEEHTPYNITVSRSAILGGSVVIDDVIDISAISSDKQNLATRQRINDVTSLKMKLLISQVRVLNLFPHKDEKKGQEALVTLTLELTNRQLAKLSIAKHISEIEIHKSIGAEQATQLYADSSDVIHSTTQQTGNAVREFRVK